MQITTGLNRNAVPDFHVSCPPGAVVHIRILSQIAGGEKLHNRYVLTDYGGVVFGVGLDSGEPGESDEVLDPVVAHPRAQNWQFTRSPPQYAGWVLDPALENLAVE